MKSSRLVLVIAFAFIFMFGLSMQTTEFITINEMPINSPNLEKNSVIAAITVTNNGGFTSAGFTGSGIEGNPYVLDGVTITTVSGGRGISITDTTSHFIIQNCIINLTSVISNYGIYLNNVDNGTIFNCTVIGTPSGLYADYSADINVTLTTVRDGTSAGIHILRTPDVDLINNTVIDILGYRGIQLYLTPNTTISGNLINRINYDSALSSSWGIDCQETHNLTISNNEIRSTMRGSGINIEVGDNVVMDSNVVWQASTCVRAYNTPSIIISNNNISCGYNYNLWMHTVTGAIVTGNSIHHTTNANGRAIHLQSSSDGIYENNDLFKCWYGMSIDANSG
ncbi:MAG: right-handed parallel beta-helix repeat-containing protein, partial [Candidatus Thorarchaeota archaeon]